MVDPLGFIVHNPSALLFQLAPGLLVGAVCGRYLVLEVKRYF
jgi:hypothetical protein